MMPCTCFCCAATCCRRGRLPCQRLQRLQRQQILLLLLVMLQVVVVPALCMRDGRPVAAIFCRLRTTQHL